jgi:hypothetical protein
MGQRTFAETVDLLSPRVYPMKDGEIAVAGMIFAAAALAEEEGKVAAHRYLKAVETEVRKARTYLRNL